MLSYNELVSKFIYLLHPLKECDLDPCRYIDSDDSDAMISDVSGYLQAELSKLGCTLIVYHSDEAPMDMYMVIGTPKTQEDKIYTFIPRCIRPRIPTYTYLV